MHKTSARIGFIKKTLHNDIALIFTKVKGWFISQLDGLSAQQKILKSYLNKYDKNLNDLIKSHYAFIFKTKCYCEKR